MFLPPRNVPELAIDSLSCVTLLLLLLLLLSFSYFRLLVCLPVLLCVIALLDTRVYLVANSCKCIHQTE